MYNWIKSKVRNIKLLKVMLLQVIKLAYNLRLIVKDIMVKVYVLFPFLLNKKYYVISRNGYSRLCGVFSNILYYLPLLDAAKKLNLIPVVKMYNYRIDNSSEDMWPLFFEKTTEKITDNNGNNKNYYSNYGYEFNRGGVHKKLNVDKILNYNKNEVMYWNEIYDEYIHYNRELNKIVEEEYKVYFEKIHKLNKKILGVKLRGSDYANNNPSGHPIQSTASEMATKVGEIMQSKNISYLYLATEDSTIVEEFKRKFTKEELIIRNKQLIGPDDENYLNSASEAANKKFGEKESILEYIKDTDLLSRTDALVTCGNSGSVMAIIMNGGRYEEVYFLDNGKF